jgi:hypothetical protein
MKKIQRNLVPLGKTRSPQTATNRENKNNGNITETNDNCKVKCIPLSIL